MPDYRRWYVPGGTYFFTVVTHHRRRFLTDDLGRRCLREAMEEEFAVRPITVVAVVLLPDHLHTVWTLPAGDAEYSLRWQRIKERFTRAFLAGGGVETPTSASRVRHRERGVWQKRFWEHLVRDENDLKNCVDYIHWNPVKHGVAKSPGAYPYSSFSWWVASGDYPPDWGANAPPEVPGAEWEE
jgi:putative transposase